MSTFDAPYLAALGAAFPGLLAGAVLFLPSLAIGAAVSDGNLEMLAAAAIALPFSLFLLIIPATWIIVLAGGLIPALVTACAGTYLRVRTFGYAALGAGVSGVYFLMWTTDKITRTPLFDGNAPIVALIAGAICGAVGGLVVGRIVTN